MRETHCRQRDLFRERRLCTVGPDHMRGPARVLEVGGRATVEEGAGGCHVNL